MREFQIGFITNPVTVRWVRILNLIEREHAFYPYSSFRTVKYYTKER